jgi:hypothetical protein
MKKFEIGSQWRSENFEFYYCHLLFNNRKAAMNAPHRWKLGEECLTGIGYDAMEYSIACLG